MNGMELNDIITIFLSSLGVIGALYTYIVHTKRLNSQQKQINEYQIRKMKEETLEKKQAWIEANVYKAGKGWKMKIYNKGKAKATNINFESQTLEEDQGINVYKDPGMFPIPSLPPQNSVELTVFLLYGHKPIHKIKFTWDDEFSSDRSQEQDVIFEVS